MAKWADFVVIRVKYDRTRTSIVEAEVRPDTGDQIARGVSRLSRQDLIFALTHGTSFVTVYQWNARWRKGEDVRLISVGNGERFIRADRNAIGADNLGFVPEYN